MKSVILAAGEGTRMRPLTYSTPKPLVLLDGRPLIEHVINSLPAEVDELVIVVGYLGNHIQNFLGSDFRGKRITYVTQEERLGTGHALELCRKHLGDERFMLLYADDLHSQRGLEAMLRYPRALLVTKHEDPSRFGVVTLNPDGTVATFVEKPQNPASNFVSTGGMVLDGHIFDYQPDLHPNGEYYLTSMFDKMLRDHPVHAVETDFWFPIATPGDIMKAEELKLAR